MEIIRITKAAGSISILHLPAASHQKAAATVVLGLQVGAVTAAAVTEATAAAGKVATAAAALDLQEAVAVVLAGVDLLRAMAAGVAERP